MLEFLKTSTLLDMLRCFSGVFFSLFSGARLLFYVIHFALLFGRMDYSPSSFRHSFCI
jgi:hypothetical protein